jgi:hypothetical protein
MIFRQLDTKGDWTFGKGLSSFAVENQALGLNIKTRVQSWFGDCFFDLEAGIDWINRLGSKNQKTLLDLDVRNVILQSEGVTGILEFNSTLINRNYVADFSIQTVYSQSYTDQIEVIF